MLNGSGEITQRPTRSANTARRRADSGTHPIDVAALLEGVELSMQVAPTTPKGPRAELFGGRHRRPADHEKWSVQTRPSHHR